MSTVNNTQALAFVALNQYADAANEGVKRLRTTFVSIGLSTVEDARPVVLAWASTKYACPLVISESNRNKGQQVLDRTHDAFMRADKAFKRAMEDLTGDADSNPSNKSEGEATEGEAEDFDVPAEIAAAAAKLVALVNAYDLKKGEMKKLAARAVADAFAAK
jgi:hypothetical protein